MWIYGLAVLQGIQDFRALNLCRLIFPPLNAMLLIVLWVSGVGDLVLVTAIWVSLYLLSALITVAVARRRVRRLPDPEPDELPSNRDLAVFGAKALLGSASPLTQFQLDQTIVGLFISQAALGIYVVAVAFTNLPRFIAQSVGLVAYPHVAAAPDGRERRARDSALLGDHDGAVRRRRRRDRGDAARSLCGTCSGRSSHRRLASHGFCSSAPSCSA